MFFYNFPVLNSCFFSFYVRRRHILYPELYKQGNQRWQTSPAAPPVCVPNFIVIGWEMAEILHFEILRKHGQTNTQTDRQTDMGITIPRPPPMGGEVTNPQDLTQDLTQDFYFSMEPWTSRVLYRYERLKQSKQVYLINNEFVKHLT